MALKIARFYAVRVGRQVGIFNSWEQCKAQVHRFSRAEYKSFNSFQDALAFIRRLHPTFQVLRPEGPMDKYFTKLQKDAEK